jgi:hypothetical protein
LVLLARRGRLAKLIIITGVGPGSRFTGLRFAGIRLIGRWRLTTVKAGGIDAEGEEFSQ